MYYILIEEDDDFNGWTIKPGCVCFFPFFRRVTVGIILLCFFRVTYKDRRNQVVLDRLVRKVKALNATYVSQHIKGLL